MSQHQTILSQPTATSRYSRIASPPRQTPGDPHLLFGVISGKPSTGKTRFFLGSPDIFLINADCSELPTGAPIHAGVWPIKNEHGQPTGPDGQPITFNIDAILATIGILEQMAANDDPTRPRTVVLDTISGLLSMMIEHVTRKANATDFKQLDGRRAWDDVYNGIINMGVRLRNAGYGVYFTCHVVDKILNLPGADTQREIISLTVTDNFWSRLFWRLDFSGTIVKEWVTITRQVRQAGRDQLVPITTQEKKHLLVTDREPLVGITKARPNLNELELSLSQGWQDFCTAYARTSATTTPETNPSE